MPKLLCKIFFFLINSIYISMRYCNILNFETNNNFIVKHCKYTILYFLSYDKFLNFNQTLSQYKNVFLIVINSFDKYN